MKKTIFTTMLATFLGSFAYGSGFQITITNLTKGQPITPPVIAAHRNGVRIFSLGKSASKGLKALAEDGMTQPLVNQLEAHQGVSVIAGSQVILPGQKATFKISGSSSSKISLVAMLARTNDAFIGLQGVSHKYHGGRYLVPVYDAGTEINNESCRYIPAPPCNNPGKSPNSPAEGFVHPHPGVQGIDDLMPLRDVFAPRGAALVEINRI